MSSEFRIDSSLFSDKYLRNEDVYAPKFFSTFKQSAAAKPICEIEMKDIEERYFEKFSLHARSSTQQIKTSMSDIIIPKDLGFLHPIILRAAQHHYEEEGFPRNDTCFLQIHSGLVAPNKCLTDLVPHADYDIVTEELGISVSDNYLISSSFATDFYTRQTPLTDEDLNAVLAAARKELETTSYGLSHVKLSEIFMKKASPPINYGVNRLVQIDSTVIHGPSQITHEDLRLFIAVRFAAPGATSL